MARRWHQFYPQCPDFDGSQPEAQTPTQQRADWLATYTRRPGQPTTRAWRPTHCTFSNQTANQTGYSHISGNVDLDIAGEREALAANWQCDRHSSVPILWARGSAYRRRVQPLLDARWEGRNETIQFTDPQGRPHAYNVTIWHPRRPAPRTMHTAWAQLAP